MNVTITPEGTNIRMTITDGKGVTNNLFSASAGSEMGLWRPIRSVLQWVAKKEIYPLTNSEPECQNCGGYGFTPVGSLCEEEECGEVRKKLAKIPTDGYFTTEQLDLVPKKYKHLFKSPA